MSADEQIVYFTAAELACMDDPEVEGYQRSLEAQRDVVEDALSLVRIERMRRKGWLP